MLIDTKIHIEIEKNEWVSYRNRNYFFRFMSIYRNFLLKCIDIYINKKTANLTMHFTQEIDNTSFV